MKVVYFSFSLEFFPSHSGLSVSVSGAAFATKSILMKPPKLIACRPGPASHLEFTLALASLLNNIPLSLTLNILARHCYDAATPPTALPSLLVSLLSCSRCCCCCCCTWLDCQLQFKNLIVWQCSLPLRSTNISPLNKSNSMAKRKPKRIHSLHIRAATCLACC